MVIVIVVAFKLTESKVYFMEKIKKLERKIGIEFEDKNLLKEALVHRSYINEHPSFELGHNERMEFLGDAVLELVVTEYLYEKYDNPEGELTNWRAALVNSKILAETADKFGLYDYLYLSRGEAKDTNPKAKNYILANAFEALIGVIYLDRGWEITKEFLLKNGVEKKFGYVFDRDLIKRNVFIKNWIAQRVKKE